MIIDDISWVPYCKNNYRDHPHTEVINRETLEILKLIPNNQDILKFIFLRGLWTCKNNKTR